MELLKTIRQKREATQRMLELEGVGAERRPRNRLRPRREIHEIVRERLLGGETDKDKLIEAAEREGHIKPGRSVNASVMTFKRYGHVEVDGREVNLTPKGKDALSREAEGV